MHQAECTRQQGHADEEDDLGMLQVIAELIEGQTPGADHHAGRKRQIECLIKAAQDFFVR